MAIAHYSKFDSYKNKIFSLTSPVEEEELLSRQFLLEKNEKKKIEIYYAPFEYVNEEAQVIIVGITPGLHQMKKSYSTVWKLKDTELSNEEILHQVKKNASFEGPMRINLISMLDELQLHKYLGISSTGELFNTANHLVHTTSIIGYPVFYNRKNYSGSTPNLLNTEMLKKYVVENFAKDLQKLSRALIIPLGVNVSKALKFLNDYDYIHFDSVLYGFPHTSGSNGHRFKQFSENKEGMVKKMKSFFG